MMASAWQAPSYQCVAQYNRTSAAGIVPEKLLSPLGRNEKLNIRGML
jgi:hypothetical protein